MSNFIHKTAVIDDTAIIGANVGIGPYSIIHPNVSIGDNVKLQNNVSVYEGVTLEDGVFCGPSCVFTNVNNPRSEIVRKDEYRKTTVKRGASIGANATIMYDWNEDMNHHANYAFSVAKQVLTAMKDDPNYFNGFTFSDRFALARNNIQSFSTMWNTLLRNIGDAYQVEG